MVDYLATLPCQESAKYKGAGHEHAAVHTCQPTNACMLKQLL